MTQTIDVGPVAPQVELRTRGAADLAPSPATSTTVAAAPPNASEGKTAHDAAPPTEPATRLLVEPGKGAEGFVYKLVDRTTGQILSEFPREAAKTLAQSQQYQAGAVLDESA